MTGFILIAAVLGWLWLAWTLTRWAMDLFQTRASKWLAGLVILPLLTVAPILDEIIGGVQFRRLCAQDTALEIGVKDPKGRTARFKADAIDAPMAGMVIPILKSQIEYRDVASGELIAKYNRFVARGGFLVRTLGFPEGGSPITIEPASCSGEGSSTALPSQLNFTVIN